VLSVAKNILPDNAKILQVGKLEEKKLSNFSTFQTPSWHSGILAFLVAFILNLWY
jgi:hypothetical protein